MPRTEIQASDFAAANLEGADFTESKITATNFSSADLRRVTFDKATLTFTRLSGADFLNTSFRDANLWEVTMTDVWLRGGDFTGAEAYLVGDRIIFEGAVVFGAYIAWQQNNPVWSSGLEADWYTKPPFGYVYASADRPAREYPATLVYIECPREFFERSAELQLGQMGDSSYEEITWAISAITGRETHFAPSVAS